MPPVMHFFYSANDSLDFLEVKIHVFTTFKLRKLTLS